MKKKQPARTRLVLQTERLRVLTSEQLGDAIGGTAGTNNGCKSADEICTKTV